ncbi:hypothetical protein BDW22DRAFT_1350595 [Trametopsis cervina]|nr:hypothetical protein BDW22DRAFT_1350595 [Trametopsis cervina]
MLACETDEDANCSVSTPFDFGVRLGLVFVVEAASLSALAVVGLLAYIGYSVSKVKANAARKWSTTTHVHWYFLSLLVSELIQSAGGIIDVKWIREAGVTEGETCTAQGVLKQIGDVSVAFASLAIALHTFFALVFRWRPEPRSKLPFFVIGFIWIFVVLIAAISLGTHKGKDYYGNTQFWCWITEQYPVQRIVLEYLWLWITCFLNFLLYVPIAFVMRYDCTLVIANWQIRFLKNSETGRATPRLEKRLALQMLVYPAVYTITTLPIAVTRWLGFTGHQVPWAATVFADVLFASSGYLNVMVFTLTRPRLLPDRETKERPFSMGPPRQSGSPVPSSLSTFHSRYTSQPTPSFDLRQSPYVSSTQLPTLGDTAKSQTNSDPQPGSPPVGATIFLPPGV